MNPKLTKEMVEALNNILANRPKSIRETINIAVRKFIGSSLLDSLTPKDRETLSGMLWHLDYLLKLFKKITSPIIIDKPLNSSAGEAVAEALGFYEYYGNTDGLLILSKIEEALFTSDSFLLDYRDYRAKYYRQFSSLRVFLIVGLNHNANTQVQTT